MHHGGEVGDDSYDQVDGEGHGGVKYSYDCDGASDGWVVRAAVFRIVTAKVV